LQGAEAAEDEEEADSEEEEEEQDRRSDPEMRRSIGDGEERDPMRETWKEPSASLAALCDPETLTLIRRLEGHEGSFFFFLLRLLRLLLLLQ
jgi:hypothetical protein